MSEAFGSRLAAAVAARGPLCVGIDPHLPLLRDWGLPDDPAGLARFAAHRGGRAGRPGGRAQAAVGVLRAASAAAGSRCWSGCCAGIRAAGALVLLDVKRGDIGSTMAGYADAYLDPASPLAATR